MLKKHSLAIAKIYFVAGFSMLLLTGSFYLFGFKPLSDSLRTHHTQEIEYFLGSNLLLLQGVINRHIELSRQIASRTAIRKKQAAYLRGDVSLDQLVTFSTPKLADALRANTEVIGISRFDPAGKLLFTVGQELPQANATQCSRETLKSIKVLTPTKIDDQRRLLYCSPVMDAEDGLVGIDMIIMEQEAITRIVNSPKGTNDKISIIALTDEEGILYWPDTSHASRARASFEAFINTGTSTITSEYIIRSEQVANTEWRLYVITNSKLFFAGIDRQLMVLLSVMGIITLLLLTLTVAVMRPFIHALLQEKKLFELSHRDSLTGLYNHAYMEELLDKELSHATRYKRPLSILMFDIDHFKAINDTYGHLAGDDVLTNIASVLLEGSREQDSAARYGGEEFLLILPETGHQGAIIKAERLRAEVAALQTKTGAGEVSATISIGVVSYDSTAGKLENRDLIQAADQAMYASKEGGRDMVTGVILPE